MKNGILRIAHVSDLHLNADNSKDLANFVIGPLVSDLTRFSQDQPIDFLCVTGDLLDRGGSSFSTPDLAFQTVRELVFGTLSTKLNLAPDRIVFTIGNHDVVRSADDEIIESGMTTSLATADQVARFQNRPETNTVGISRTTSYKEFERSYYEPLNPTDHQITPFEAIHVYALGSTGVGISALNSSWRCWDSTTDKGALLVGETQLTRSVNFLKDCSIRIGLIHHPLEFLSDFDRRSIEPFLMREYDMVLFGHVHDHDSWSKTNVYGTIFVSVAPANWTYNLRAPENPFVNGYSLLDFNVTDRKVTVHPRRYAHAKTEYVPDSDKCVSGDSFTLLLRSPESVNVFAKAHSLIQLIRQEHFEELDQDLLTYATDSEAPKTVAEIFVEPRIVCKQTYATEDSVPDPKEVCITLVEITQSNENTIVFGTKESGKTVLLDRLLIEFTNAFNTLETTPIKIDLSNFTHSRFETAISQFLRLPILEVRDFLLNNRVALLLDNLSLAEADRELIRLLSELQAEFPNVRVIATSAHTIEGQVPVELTAFPHLLRFKHLLLRPYLSHHIKELATKWFARSHKHDPEERLQNIIKTLLELSLPRTPLAISMFLWIIEKFDSYAPINEATMLENFVEQLFKKHAKTEVYSSVFDYRNKEHLLAEIAHDMYGRGGDNYSVSYSSLLDFVADYLEKRQFSFDATAIVDEFVFRGVLIREVTGSTPYLRFRFNCFFQFFLMKKMDFDGQFLTVVLQPQNFLAFPDELDYYTGLKRDQKAILQMLIGRMKNEFADIVATISEQDHTYDQFFSETPATITDKLDRQFIDGMNQAREDAKKQLAEITDKILDETPSGSRIRKKDLTISRFRRLELLWTLCARVLRNTEEVDEPGLKLRALTDIIECSMAFAVVHKIVLLDYLHEHRKKLTPDQTDFLEVTEEYMPLIHEMYLHQLVSTAKLNIVFLDYLSNTFASKSASDLSRFLAVFLYADARGHRYHEYIRKLISHAKQKYLFDMMLFKLVMYYFTRAKDKNSEVLFENLIADLIVTARGLKKNQKGRIIKDYKARRKTYRKESTQQDLDF